MTIVQLEYIVAVDTYRNFVTAAEKCFITQPTLSMQIQKLEDELGIKIFNRSKTPVVPTPIGIKLIEQARVIIQESARIKEIIAEEKHETKGSLRVGIIPTIAPYLLPNIIAAFIKKYPGVKLEIWEYPTEQICEKLKAELLDCGLMATPLQDNQLKETPLFYETFVVYIARSHPLFAHKTLNADELNIADMWLLNEGHCMRNQVLNICRDNKNYQDHKNMDYNTGSVETLKRLVDLNNGLTILPELATYDLLPQQQEMVRYFKQPEPVREISLVTQKHFIKRALIEAFQQEIFSIIPEKMKAKNEKQVIDIKH